ncbi:MAG: hypothetical protein J5I93_10100 [Pirellulaceae bacterium]|nr:hypothetical protein [Pirellulaceae bacterium]
MTASYSQFDVQFQYPENWSVTDEQKSGWPRSVTVQSPGTVFWSLHVYPASSAPANLANQAVQAMAEEYQGLEAEPVRCELAGHDAPGFSMDFEYLDLIVRARVLQIQHGQHVFLVLCQGEDSEFERLEPVLLAITTSLLLGK